MWYLIVFRRFAGSHLDAQGAGRPARIWGTAIFFQFLVSIYGGYFGAAQGVIMMALLSTFLPEDLQRLNALKNVLAVLINGVAAVLFIAAAPVAWPAAILIAVGAIAGGQVGALVGRRLPASTLRLAIIVLGTFVGLRLLIG